MPVRPDPALTYAEAAGRQRRTSSEPVCPAVPAQAPPGPANQNEQTTQPLAAQRKENQIQ